MSDESSIHYTQPMFTDEHGNGHAVAMRANAGSSERARYATEYDGTEQSEEAQWNGWLGRNLLHERKLMSKAVVNVLADVLAEYDDKIDKLERTVERLVGANERLAGAVDVLRTGRMMRVRGTYAADAEYKLFDIVMLNGSSFIALEDRPGACPGEHWQLLASCGSRGARGRVGPKGARGDPGLSALPAAGIKKLHVDVKTYTLSIFASDGVHQLALRPLFQRFYNESR